MTEDSKRRRPPAFPEAVADALRHAKAIERGRAATVDALDARADAAAFADLVFALHAQVIDARALLEAGRWSEARANLDRMIDGLDRLVSDVSESSTR